MKKFFDHEFHRRQVSVIAQGCLTNSKSPDCFVKGVYPNVIEYAEGCNLYDEKRNCFVDYICGLGTNLFGYGNREITDAIISELRAGISYSLSSKTEVEAGERLKGLLKFIERVKFVKTGSEACSAAIKIARAYTGRQFVLSQGYHGWHDEFTSLTPPALGVCPQTYMHKLTSVDQVNSDIAAVIVEPVDLDNSPDRLIFLKQLREKCTEKGVVLIFDEIITGARYKDFCVAQNIDIIPDLILFGKAIAGGMPLALVGGRKELMDGQYFVSSTYAGENASLTAFKVILDLLQTKYDIDVLWSLGSDFIERFNSFWPERILLKGYGTRARFFGDEATKNYFWQEAVRAGVLFGPSWFINFCHEDCHYRVLELLKDVIMRMKLIVNFKLDGDAPKSPFSAKARS